LAFDLADEYGYNTRGARSPHRIAAVGCLREAATMTDQTERAGWGRVLLSVAAGLVLVVIVLSAIGAFAYFWPATQKLHEAPHSEDARTTIKHHRLGVREIAFSPDGKILASGGREPTVFLWDGTTGKLHGTLEGEGFSGCVLSVAFAPDGRSLAATDGLGTFVVWDLQTGKELTMRRGQKERMTYLAYSPDGSTLASGSSDNTVKLWDVKTWKERVTLTGDNPVLCLAFSPDGKTLATGTWGPEALRLWDVSTGKEKGVLRSDASRIEWLAFSPDGNTLAAVDSSGHGMMLWDVEARKVGRRGPATRCAVFAPDGRRLAYGSGKDVRIWDIETDKIEMAPTGHVTDVSCLAISPDGKTVAAGSCGEIERPGFDGLFDEGPGEIKVWDLPNR
jgi:WD40 repeat protein